jgi:hypothetical protein
MRLPASVATSKGMEIRSISATLITWRNRMWGNSSLGKMRYCNGALTIHLCPWQERVKIHRGEPSLKMGR